ncbi:MAG: HupE/UreJ family protein [Salinisphaeraceae bacterium]|nr:HupE/UreJ family protein [Salinisphaeraceae bacterium]
MFRKLQASLGYILLAGLLIWPVTGYTHQLQGVALSLQAYEDGQVDANLKIQVRRDGRPVNLLPVLSPDCQPQGQPSLQRIDERILRQWTMYCPGGLQGRRLEMTGLGPSVPEAIVTIGFEDGETRTAVLDREQPYLFIEQLPASTGPGGLVAYFPIGIEHILLGPDHLLFVLCLLLVIRQARGGMAGLFLTITAFTVAHSFTLGLSVWFELSLPSAPVEAVIALSILLLAAELARSQRHGDYPSLSIKRPALIAFVFGLLHGFGFAGALKEIGLPEAAQGWALFLFNLGVEAGQLIFVAAVIALAWLAQRSLRMPVHVLANLLVVFTGALSALWFIDRLQPVLGL